MRVSMQVQENPFNVESTRQYMRLLARNYQGIAFPLSVLIRSTQIRGLDGGLSKNILFVSRSLCKLKLPSFSSANMSDEEGFAGDLFGAEEASPPPPEPTFEIYDRDPRCLDKQSSVKQLTIRLVGSHPLWAHHLWNASKVSASFFDENKDIVRNRTVLELGAGGALPSLIAAASGAAKVVVTDYPDAELIDNIRYNVSTNNLTDDERVIVQGYVWGTSTDKLREQLPEGQSTFDVIILSDLVFNHSEHHAMLRTCRELLTPKTGRAYVFYTHHRPHLAHKDLEFFDIAQRPYSKDLDPDDREAMGYGFQVDHFIQKKMHVMFEEDPGDVEIRATVHGWQMWIP